MESIIESVVNQSEKDQFKASLMQFHKETFIKKNPELEYVTPKYEHAFNIVVGHAGRALLKIYKRAYTQCACNQKSICFKIFKGSFFIINYKF